MPNFQLHALPSYGDHMTIEDFVEAVKEYGFVNDDGTGRYATAREESNIAAVPSEIREKGPLPGWTHVMWYNK